MNTDQILCGDNVTVLRGLPDACVQTCVTSPPYYGLRDYGTATWEGGSPDCDHAYQKGGRNPETSSKQISNAGTTFSQYETACKKCGALRVDNQIGLESTPGEYVTRLVEVFREVWRVMKDDGTLWLNLGDSYAGSGKGPTGWNGIGDQETRQGFSSRGAAIGSKHGDSGHTSGVKPPAGMKAKDLIGIPWMVAFALRADGWYLRSDIIWNKPNPMPESVTDRPTKSHEYIFLLSKSERYFYDAEAILEPVSGGTHARVSQNVMAQIGSFRANGGAKTNGPMKAVVRTPKQQPAGSGIKNNDSFNNAVVMPVLERNKRTVWTVTTKPYAEAHFATFPPDLIKPCILAGSRVGDVVLDPFFGSGTTGFVARELGRHYIGIDLNPEYIKLAERRTARANVPLPGLV